MSADGMELEGGLSLKAARVWGEIRLLGAEIEGDLNCNSVRFCNRGESAFSADKIRVRGGVSFSGAIVYGEIRLVGANIGGNLEFAPTHFRNGEGRALNADGMRVAGSLYLREDMLGQGAIVEGTIVLTGTEIDRLDFHPAISSDIKALSLGGARIKTWRYSVEGLAAVDKLKLDGCVYEKLLAANNDDGHPDFRIRLPHGADFKPQPYTQLAKVLKADGHEDTAREVLIERQEALRETTPRRGLRWVWLTFQKYVAGYGYRPRWTLQWLVAFWLVGTLLFGLAGMSAPAKPLADRLMVPARLGTFLPKGANGQAKANVTEIPAQYPRFEPSVYSLDALVPFLDLQQEDYWLPNANAGALVSSRPCIAWAGCYTSGTLLRWYLWFHIAVGWLFGTMFVASITGLIKKE